MTVNPMTYQDFIEEWNNECKFITAHTSGSTGNPKEIRLNKDFVRQSAIRTNNFFGINEGSHLHSCVSPEFIGGKMMAVRALLAGAELSWEMPSNQPSLISPGQRKTVDLLAVVPSQMPYIINHITDFPEIRNIIIGGSAIHPELRTKIINSGLSAYETYGMTETASHIALRKITPQESPFICLPGITVDSDKENCLKINIIQDGEILSAIQTNDIARVVSPTEFFIKGRRDNIIVSGGRKINPFEIEELVAPYIGYPFFITGIPDEKWGEKLVLVAECEKSEELENKLISIFQNLRNSGKLEGWQVPKSYIFLPSLPRTPNGKLLRKAPL